MSTVGIYKITSPTGKVYIGQSWNIEKRWREHRANFGKSKLLNSLRKYGNESHDFKIIHPLPKDEIQQTLNVYEQVYLDAYRDCGVEVMNLREAGSHGTHSPETRKIISEKGKGRKMSEKTKAALSLFLKGHKYNVGRKRTEEHKLKISLSQKGSIHSPEHNRKNSEAKKGEKCHWYGIEHGKHPLAKKIRCQKTGIVYPTVMEAAQSIGVKRTTLSMWLTGKNKNKTSLVYDFK